ncbi:MAG TPA: EAL domain-containing protein [Terracidiphilus sp.]|nr:EAL domain-containing protein [Terracidiphilus sp.]
MLVGTYNVWLVLASLLIAMLASYTALDMAGRVSETQGKSARWWLAGGSVAMGIGIWSMHFLGMLAFSLPIPMGYDPFITLLSLLFGIASSAFALWMVCQSKLSWGRLLIGAVLMGAGICSMHYTGMAAMRMNPGIHYIPSLFMLSVLIAVVASGAALWIAFHLRQRSSHIRLLRSGAAVVMGFAITGMHYTGMAAAQFPKGSICSMSSAGLSTGWMALLIIVFALSVLSIALIISMLDFRMEARTAILASSLDRANEELQFLALHDSLTKLPNRTLLEDRLDQEIENAKRNQKPFSVLFLDLDGFKQVNDAFGHQVGDLLLIEVAQRIRAAVRARDTIARVGGDEFILLADASEPADAASLASKLILAIQKPYAIGGHDCQVTVSVGITLYAEDTRRETLLKNADAAMYHAKALGKNTYCFFEVSMNDDAQKKLQVLHDLHLAMDRREFVLYYQPKFDAHSGAMLGAEALIRWNHPTRGLLAPADFIPLAEKIGLIVPIGEWTVQEACRQMSEWKKAGYTDWTVAVNLSAVQFNHPGLIDLVQHSLDRCALDPKHLILEITESTAMRDPNTSMNILQKLHEMGVRISIDDFGTGYSSLLYLKRLPAGELKIDRGFVRELSEETADAAIISAIVALGRTLNLEIVAEGVETVAQQEFLTSLGCTSLQGFLLGRPMPPDQLIAAISQGRTAWDLQESSGTGHAPKLVAQIPAGATAA